MPWRFQISRTEHRMPWGL